MNEMDDTNYNSIPPKQMPTVNVHVNNLGKDEPLPYYGMSDEKFKEMAEFEESCDCTAISPNLLQKLAGMDGTEKLSGEGFDFIKKKQHFFYVAWQDDTGKIIDIKHYDDYDMALMRAMQNAKTTGTTYTIRDLNGRFIDGNFISK